MIGSWTLPGWYEQGFLENTSNPGWKPGDPIKPDDDWRPDYRAMVEWQITRSGIDLDNYTSEDAVNPAALGGGHASNHHAAHGNIPHARDLYITKVNRATYRTSA